jgi:hypothetical protein
MPRKKRPRKPCPDPLRYEWVNSKEGGYWRLKRMSSAVNKTLKENSNNMTIVSPVNKQIRDLLQPYRKEMGRFRLSGEMNKRLMRGRRETGKTDLRYLRGLNFQEVYTMDKIIGREYIKTERDLVKQVYRVSVPMLEEHVSEWPNAGVTEYRFGLIIIQQRKRRKQTIVNDVYSANYPCGAKDGEIVLELPLAKDTVWWMACLKFECFVGRFAITSHRQVRLEVMDAEGEV